LDGLNSYVGTEAQTVFSAIGYPDRKEMIGDNTVYHWGTDQPEGPSCIVKIVADPAGKVLETDAYGNPEGCARYKSGLKRALRGR
jgi:hypothetical protein